MTGRQKSRKKYCLKLRYGVSLEQYQQLLEQQNHCCAICLRPESYVHKGSGKVMSLSLDHDHETGRVRGLLCRRCNTNLGMFFDDCSMLERACNYIRQSLNGVQCA